uniref:Uncharacterized protein n=1 Tax=Glycine max TaxID=3847 RepID=K7LLJ5_SOYBN
MSFLHGLLKKLLFDMILLTIKSKSQFDNGDILISGDAKTNNILYCTGRSVIIRNLDNPLQVWVYCEHAYPVTVARYSPNGEWIAYADVSGTVRIWGTHIEFVLKNEIVACGDGKGKSFVRAFMWDSGSTVGDFDGHSHRVLSCAFKTTRPFRIVTCGEDFLANFYDGPPFKFNMSIRDHTNFVNCVRFSPDGSKFITVSSGRKGTIYDGKTGNKLGELSMEDGHKGSIYAVSWSPDSKQVLTVSADKSAKVWDIVEDGSSGTVNKTLTCTESGGVEDMLVGRLWQNDYLLTICLGGTTYLYSAKDLDKSPLSLSGHMKNITVLTMLNRSEKMLLSSSYDGVVIRWIPGMGYIVLNNMLFNTARINCLAWSPDSTLIAPGSLDTCVIIYEVGKPASSRRTIKGAHIGGVYGLVFIDQERVVSSGEDGCVRVWNLISE